MLDSTPTAGQKKNLAVVETRAFDFFSTRESLDSSDWKKYLFAADSLIPRHQNGVNFRRRTTPSPAAPCAHNLSSLEPTLVEALHARCLLSVSCWRRGKMAEFGAVAVGGGQPPEPPEVLIERPSRSSVSFVIVLQWLC